MVSVHQTVGVYLSWSFVCGYCYAAFTTLFIAVTTGMFFQWIVCIGIWIVGLVVNMARNNPPLFLPSVVGGVFWCTGKIIRVLIL